MIIGFPPATDVGLTTDLSNSRGPIVRISRGEAEGQRVDNNRLPGRVSQFVGQNEYALSIFGLCWRFRIPARSIPTFHKYQECRLIVGGKGRGRPSVAWNLILPLDEIHSPTDRTPPSSIPFSGSLDSPRVGREAEGGGNN